MFCSECGEKLIATDQKFCHNCGTEVLTSSKATEHRSERVQYVSPPKIHYAPVKQQPRLEKGRPGKYSKLSLEFAIISIVIGFVTIIIGYNFYRYLFYPYENIIGRVLVSIVILLLRVGGLILGVLSKVNSSKAEIYEPYNDIEKAGSIFAILGIIINAMGLTLSLFGPWSIFIYPYWYFKWYEWKGKELATILIDLTALF